jgi:plasmid stabilization system protein ParE
VKVELYPQAEDDIVRQFRYYLLEQDAPLVAVRFREAVIETISQIKSQPRIGAMLKGPVTGIRSWPVRGFYAIRIYYLEDPNKLRIVRILHGNRNVRQLLRQNKLL